MSALRVILATANPAKAERLRRLCAGLTLALEDGREMTAAPETPEETGTSHMANAVLKAVAWSRALDGAVTLASDGGLSIPALGADWRSLLTRRATEQAAGGRAPTDADRARWLLAMLRRLKDGDRAAFWTEAVAIARRGVLTGAWEASGMRGAIAQDFLPDAGTAGGFWVSGLWVSPSGKRLWQLTPDELAGADEPWTRIEGPARDMLARMSAATPAG